ncbi:hypothetical protein CEUSTIGMA_g663.t1 [Chlamydomonas eustigma]|uniref:Protein kinase domain-containing protein n=1 Tax=Chlamydomonas eustigma TaxID=1157962 RepID=A0A250WRN6_9CHLO|nr:hypothetical protein CEUSTIGMA_g663.t1 [Chlamydomonas eustigma]|eukprot:GAX73210.1 hypothetical protein CEUSTIGMA_g663.t1 [Chlamydomonas eustigma]
MQRSGDTQLGATNKPARAKPRHKSGPQQDEQVLSFVRKLGENKPLKVLKGNHNNAPNQVPRTGLPRVLADVGPHENLILPAQNIVKKSNNVKQLSNGSNKQMTPPATTHNNDDTTSAGANKQRGAGHHDPCSVLHIPSTPSSHSSSSSSSDDDEGMMSSSRTSSERSVHSGGHSNCSEMKQQALLTIPACCPCIAPAAPPPAALNKHTALSPAASKPAWRLPSKCISNQQMNRMSPSCQHLPSGSRASMLKKAGGGHKKPAAAISNHPQQPVAANKPVLQVPSTITSVVSVGVQVSLEDTEAVHDDLAADITTRVQELETRMAECATLVTRLICEKEEALLTTEHQGQALRAEQELRKCLEEECERLRVQFDQCDAHHDASCIITLQLVLNKADAVDADNESISSNKDIGLVCVAEAVQQVAVAEKKTMMRPAALSVDEMMRPHLEVHEELVRLQEQYKSLEAEVQEYKDQEVRYEEMLDMCRSEIAALTQSSDSARQEAEDELRLRKHQEDRIAQLKKWMVLHGKPLKRINREDLECSHIMEQIGQGGWGEVFRIKYGPHRGSIYKHALPGLEMEMDSEVVTMYWAMIANASPNIMCLVVEDVSPGGSRWRMCHQAVVGCLVVEDVSPGGSRTRCPHRKMDLIIYAASKSLQTLHKAGIVHNDLKASNFLVNDHRGVKVSDFGTSLFMDATGHVEGPTLGTSGYAAPETLTTGQVSAAADVYSLGCMLYAMISGQQAHQGLYSNDQEYSELMLSGNVPQLTLRPEDVAMYGKIAAPLLLDLVTRTTHVEPQQRPSMKEVLDLLLNIKMNIMS